MDSLPGDAEIENDARSAVWTALLCGKSRRPGEVPSVHWMYSLSPCESTSASRLASRVLLLVVTLR